MTSKLLNVVLYVDENMVFGVSRDDSIPKLGDGELLIKTRFSGVNPADINYDFFGKVLKAPLGSVFKVGQTVAGYTLTGVG
ncbi:unnamed protein product [Penicillium manginii]